MKRIVIDKLSLKNFKGCRALELDFGGKDASIYGDNATGKTTVYDGLTWLLFGKDSRGNGEKVMDIKPLDQDGNVLDHQAVTEVEAVLRVTEANEPGSRTAADPSTTLAGGPPPLGRGGLAVTLRKTMRESWVSRRGSSSLVYDGNLFEYYADGVPMKKNEFAARVKELVEEDTWGLLTSVTAFAQDLPWQKRRAVLYDMSGVSSLSDRALMQQMARTYGGGDCHGPEGPRNDNGGSVEAIETLVELLRGSRSLEDLKKILVQKQRALKGSKNDIPARLAELGLQKEKLEAMDYAGAEAGLQAAEQEAEGHRKTLAALETQTETETERQLRAANQEKAELEAKRAALISQQTMELARLRGALSSLDTENLRHRMDQERRLPNLPQLQRQAEELARRQKLKIDDAGSDEDEANGLDRLVENCRKEYLEISQEQFEGGTCPTCGQELPLEMLTEAREKFFRNRKARLVDCANRATGHKERAAMLRGRAQELRAEAEAMQAEVDEAMEALEAARKAPRTVEDLGDYRERKEALEKALEAAGINPELTDVDRAIAKIRAKAAALREQAALESADRDKPIQAAREALQAAQAKAEAARGVLAQGKMLATLEARETELRGNLKDAAAQLEQVDRQLWAMEEFVRFKAKLIEDNVNGLFRLVTFRMFREQANGGLEERCDVVLNGVPYPSLNNGAKINVGCDIIRRLSEHYGVAVPLFVDNAESVTRLEEAGTQVVRLVVSAEDKVLRVETV